MKLSVKLLLTAVLFPLGLMAGDLSPGKKQIQFGLKAGLTSSKFNNAIGPFARNENMFFPDKRISTEVGAVLTYKLKNAINLRGEIVYSMKGMSYRKQLPAVITYTSAGESKTYFYHTLRLNYFEVPLTAGINITKSFISKTAKGGIYLYAGIAPAWCMESSYENGGRGIEWAENPSIEISAISSGSFRYERKLMMNFLSEISFNSPVSAHSEVFIYCRLMKSAGNVYTQANLYDGNLKTAMTTLSLGAGFNF